jgi:hypothetical protein
MTFSTTASAKTAGSTPRPVFAGHPPSRFEEERGLEAVLPDRPQLRVRKFNRLHKRIAR